ncbi:MAG: hypothetical protein U0361_03365 [Nitrospiraceae bacterium]
MSRSAFFLAEDEQLSNRIVGQERRAAVSKAHHSVVRIDQSTI